MGIEGKVEKEGRREALIVGPVLALPCIGHCWTVLLGDSTVALGRAFQVQPLSPQLE